MTGFGAPDRSDEATSPVTCPLPAQACRLILEAYSFTIKLYSFCVTPSLGDVSTQRLLYFLRFPLRMTSFVPDNYSTVHVGFRKTQLSTQSWHCQEPNNPVSTQLYA